MLNRSPWLLIRFRVVTILLVGALATALSAWLLAHYNQQQLDSVVTVAMNDAVAKIQNRLALYQYGLGGARGVVATAGDQQITRRQFHNSSLTRDVDVEFPGARGFGFIRRVPLSDEARFVQAAQADDQPDFSIRQLAPHNGARFVIQYIEPVERNAPAIGLDIASEFNRRHAAVSAMRTGKPRLSGPITLVQAANSLEQAFLLVMPIYKSIVTPNTVAAREAELVGWSYAPLLMREVLAGLNLDNDLTHLAIWDVTLTNTSQPFYRSEEDGHPLILSQTRDMKIYGREWKIKFSIHSAFVDNLHQTSPFWILASGGVFSVLLAILAGTLSISAQRNKQIITERAHLGAIVESSADGIIGETLDSVITSWNKGAEQIFGFKPERVIGKRVAEMLVPESLQDEEADIQARIKRGEFVPNFETQRLRDDGSLLDVSVTVSPIRDERGHIVGASKTVRDISLQKAAEAKLHENNDWLEQEVEARTGELRQVNQLLRSVLYSASEVSIIATDVNGIITVFNHGAENMLGYCADEIIDINTPAIFHIEAEISARSAELTKIYGFPIEGFRAFVHKPEIDGAETREWTAVRKNGTTLQVQMMITTIRNEQNVITGYLGMAVDITQRKIAQQALTASLEMTRAILDTTVQPIVTIDAHGIVRSINKAGTQQLGYAPDDIIGNNVSMLMPEPFHSEHDGYLARYLREGTPRIIGIGREVTAKRHDGTLFPIQLSVGSMVVNGEHMFVGMMVDISTLVRQRNELITMRDQLTMASEVADLGIWIWELGENSLRWNDRMFALYDWPLTTSITYAHWRSRIHPDDVANIEAQLNAAVEGNNIYDPVFRIVRNDGSVLYIQAAAHVERDVYGHAIRVTGIYRDVTAQHELEASLRYAKVQAEAASAAKSNFLANMSHEIRTPMNAVLGMLSILQKTPLNTQQRDYTEKAHSAGQSLLGLLNDILDYSKIEAHKLELETHAFALDVLMRELSIVLDGNVGAKPVEIKFEIDAKIPNELIGDSLRLKQVLVNLSGNALKFTTAGHVAISVSALQQNVDDIRLRFAVSDTGIGISAEQRERIFESFTQAEASTSRRFGGTGLGLVICRRLVTLMGGEIQLESTPGQGSRFWFDIPLKIAAQDVTDAKPAQETDARDLPEGVPPLTGLRLLLVDDNELNRLVANLLLEDEGAIVSLATGGLEAVAMVLENTHHYDAVLMDMQMPDIDGLEATRRIRAHAEFNHLPIIAMTANVADSDRDACLAAGMIGHIGKPIDADHLVSTLLSVTKRQNSQPAKPDQLA